MLLCFQYIQKVIAALATIAYAQALSGASKIGRNVYWLHPHISRQTIYSRVSNIKIVQT
jgi:hypothetical protein